LIFPVLLSIACPTTSRLLSETPGGNVSRNNVSPQTAIPPCPSFGSGWCQTMFWLAATLHEVGALAALTRQVPFGPAACGQLATLPSAGDEGPLASSPGPLPPLELPEDESEPLPELVLASLTLVESLPPLPELPSLALPLLEPLPEALLEPLPEALLDPVEAPLRAGASVPQAHPKSGPPRKQARAPATRIDDLRSKSMDHHPQGK